FRTFTVRCHLHKFWIKLTNNFYEIGLSSHDRMNVFVNHWDFIETGREQGDTAIPQEPVDILPIKRLRRFGSAHHASRAVRRGVERLILAFAAHNETR